MIGDAALGAPVAGVRPLRFVPRASIPVEAACLVANALREMLREALGDPTELMIGEPVAIDAAAWALLAGDALLFLTRGRQTDVVLVVPRRDARRLVLRAFGEPDDPAGVPEPPETAWSALEMRAVERIAGRCAAAFEPLCADRRPAALPVQSREVPACTAYFDVRVQAPVALTLGVGIVRDLPDPGPTGSLAAGALEAVPMEARAVFAEGMMSMTSFAALRPGVTVKLDTKVGDPASLNVAGRRLAYGVAGVVASRSAFLVRDVASGANP